MSKNEILKKFVILYWIQLIAWVPLFGFAVWVAVNLEALQSYLTGTEYQLSFFTSPSMTIVALSIGLLVAITLLRLSRRALKSESKEQAEDDAQSLVATVKLTGYVVTPASIALLFTAPAMVATGVIGLATLAPLLVGLAISLRGTFLRKELEPLLEPREVNRSKSWFDDVPSAENFEFKNYSSDPAVAAPVPEVAPAASDPAVAAQVKMTNLLFGSIAILGVNLLFLLSANSNYAPGGIGVASDIGLVVFDFLMVPFALYIIYKAVDLLSKGAKWYWALLAVTASGISLFIVPIA